VSCTWFVDGASWRGMASTRVMVPKDCNRSGRWRAAHLPAHQRGRWMDGTLQARGPSHGHALQLQRWPMRFICAPACWPQMSRSRQPSLCSPGPREGPRGRTMESERFVADSSLPLMEPPCMLACRSAVGSHVHACLAKCPAFSEQKGSDTHSTQSQQRTQRLCLCLAASEAVLNRQGS